jgi:ADP-heptose:LPS heptosyltransferase
MLFVKLAEQGATVLAYPAIRRAAEMVGRENVFFLVFEENRFILDCMDVIPAENVIAIRTGGLRVFWGAIRALSRVRKTRPDAAVDFEFFARSSAAITFLSGARIRVGLHPCGEKAPYRGDLMTHRVRYDPELHTADAFAAMVEAVNLSPEELSAAGGRLPAVDEDRAPHDDLPIFAPLPEEVAKVRSVLEREAATTDYSPLALLNANASDLLPLRRWPSQRYVELAQRLLGDWPDLHVAFTGAPDEAAASEALVAAVGSSRCFSMAGKTTLRELLVLYGLADVLVTNDSGPAHFATLTPIRVITLFGPETPALFGARSPRAHLVWKGLPCSPCVNAYNNRLSECNDNQCMQQITVGEVIDVARGVLRSAHECDRRGRLERPAAD